MLGHGWPSFGVFSSRNPKPERNVTSFLHRLFAVMVAAILCLPSIASAEQIPSAPTLVEGQHAYTIPDGWVPELLGEAGLAKINEQGAALHYPFYAVFIQSLGCEAGNDGSIIGTTADSFAQTWMTASAGYDVQNTQVFVLSFDPNCKKPALLAGARFKNELGLEQGALKPFMDVFMQHVRGTPKDPALGTVEMMKAFDTHVWDRTDGADLRQAQMIRSAIIVVIILIVLGIIGFFVWRKRRFEGLKAQWQSLHDGWEGTLRGYSSLYTGFFMSEVDKVKMLAGQGGTTGALYKEVTDAANLMQGWIEAMKARLGACEMTAREATPGNIQPLLDAMENLQAAFEVEPDAMADRPSLFGPVTVKLTIDPAKLEAKLEAKRQQVRPKWELLLRATEVAAMDSRTEFPHTGFDALLETCQEHGIAEDWLSAHPLAGDDEADRALWDEVDGLRDNDAAAFIERIDALKGQEAAVQALLRRVVSATSRVRSSHIDACPAVGDIVLDPSDDPSVSFAHAVRTEQRFQAQLDSGDGIDSLEALASQTARYYSQAVSQARAANAAKGNAERSIEGAKRTQAKAASDGEGARSTVDAAKRVHSNVQADGDLRAGAQYEETGASQLSEAERLFTARRYLNAGRSANTANGTFANASREYKEAVAHCQELDRRKAEFDRVLASMVTTHRSIQTNITTRYESTAIITYTPAHVGSGAQNYTELLRGLKAQISSWRGVERDAKRAWERKQEMLRQARRRFDSALDDLQTLLASQDCPSGYEIATASTVVASASMNRALKEPDQIDAATAGIEAAEAALRPIVTRRRRARLQREKEERERREAAERARQLAAQQAAQAAAAALAAQQMRQEAADRRTQDAPSTPVFTPPPAPRGGDYSSAQVGASVDNHSSALVGDDW